MARIQIARGSKVKIPPFSGVDPSLLYGELYWAAVEPGVDSGTLFVGQKVGDPLPIAGTRAMASLFYQGSWDASTAAFPPGVPGDFHIVVVDGHVGTELFFVGDWVVQTGPSSWNRVRNQSISATGPLSLGAGQDQVLSLALDPTALVVDGQGRLAAVDPTRKTLLAGETLTPGQVVCVLPDSTVVRADASNVAHAPALGIVVVGGAAGQFVVTKTSGFVAYPGGLAVGAPLYLSVLGTLTADASTITTGQVLQYLGVATSATEIALALGSPAVVDASASNYWIPLTQVLTPADATHAPSAAAVLAALPPPGQGTAYPVAPGFGQDFWRTDLGHWFKYNGSTWTQID